MWVCVHIFIVHTTRLTHLSCERAAATPRRRPGSAFIICAVIFGPHANTTSNYKHTHTRTRRREIARHANLLTTTTASTWQKFAGIYCRSARRTAALFQCIRKFASHRLSGGAVFFCSRSLSLAFPFCEINIWGVNRIKFRFLTFDRRRRRRPPGASGHVVDDIFVSIAARIRTHGNGPSVRPFPPGVSHTQKKKTGKNRPLLWHMRRVLR